MAKMKSMGGVAALSGMAEGMADSETEPLVSSGSSKCCRKSVILNMGRRCFAEFIGTALYMFVGATSVSNFVGNSEPHLPTVALTYGFCYAGLSGATLNVR